MIYVDSSVALAHLLAEDRRMPDEIWDQPLSSSRLLIYEVWNRIYARGIADSHHGEARRVLGRVIMIEMSPHVLQRALKPFPFAPRTLDSLHLASMEHLRSEGHVVELASFDDRLVGSASALGIAVYQS